MVLIMRDDIFFFFAVKVGGVYGLPIINHIEKISSRRINIAAAATIGIITRGVFYRSVRKRSIVVTLRSWT